jgi:hypothetical protein
VARRAGGYGALMGAIKPWDLLACLSAVMGTVTVLVRLARRR